jgi:5-formyltetrahydrofolate cyclo-ligase
MTGDNDTSDDDVILRKKALRKEIRARLKGLDEDTIKEQSQQVWDRLFSLKEYQEAKSVGLFLSMPNGEINTDPALLDCMKKGKKIFVPEVGKNFELANMELVQVVMNGNSVNEIFHKNWPRNKWNIPEPPADMPIVTAKPGDIDVLVVPGLAFDRSGDRLGHGKGYYDRFIARMCNETNNAKTPFLVAVGSASTSSQ